MSPARTHAEADAAVAALDPLGADALLSGLPALNRDRDAARLRHLADRLAERAQDVHEPEPARAALRDLGIAAASWCRLHPDRPPAERVAAELLRLAELTGEPPRDSLPSYTTRNPAGPRRRSFTGTAAEELFIAGLATGAQVLDEAVGHCVALGAAVDQDRPHDGAAAARATGEAFAAFTRLFHTVRRGMTGRFFAEELRPFFPPIDLDGQTWQAPSGAHLPILTLDVLLYSGTAAGRQDGDAASADAVFTAHATGALPYLRPDHRELVLAQAGRPGLVARLAARPAGGADALLRAAVAELTRAFLRFRYPHRKLARDALEARLGPPVGGPYRIEPLEELIAVVRAAGDALAPRPDGDRVP
ncbi:monodechloroaminopyrrolnitrin synthase PrnB family protein [Kitasatospora sp. NPDC097691]|uniref:monodechloroaminopyrrolnitrin synthase PrnB family protein n=1 Tax=Kitasatospora sp. NPDC097691 TaxID=3157231 RepID=UPI00332B78FF